VFYLSKIIIILDAEPQQGDSVKNWNPAQIIEETPGLSDCERAVLRERHSLPHPNGFVVPGYLRKYHPIHKMILEDLERRNIPLAFGATQDGVAVFPRVIIMTV
jgi:hypothetical protein